MGTVPRINRKRIERTLPSGRRARWVSVAGSLRSDLEKRRWKPGERLPATRLLATEFHCNRETLFAALGQLQAEGWLDAAPRRGYFVKQDSCELPLPKIQAPVFVVPLAHAPDFWKPFVLPSTKFQLHSATPDPELFPKRELAAALSFASRRLPARSFDTCPAAGLPRLREALLIYLRRRRALVVEDLVLTCGSQAALTFVARALVNPGDRIAVEDPGYRPAWDCFQAAGAKLVPIPVDSGGLDINALEQQAAHAPIRAVYVTPARQYPTTVTLGAQRRQALLELTRQRQIVVIEDDYDHEHSYRAMTVAPLAASSGAEHVVYVGTLSKLISPVVRVGFIAGAETVLQRIAHLSAAWLGPPDALLQTALALFIEEGALDRHLTRTRRVYEARRDALFAALQKYCPELTLSLPEGGLALFAVAPKLCSLRLAQAALEHGVSIVPEGVLTHSKQTRHGLRLAFSRLPEPKAPSAAQALARALTNCSK